ncbi:hypothetical protein [Rossellomorea marisflavi]|uniref:hypothetical protein n=1 Tax=Rossellomorea marisflavi TaxID=189381 RepID=UPI0009A7B1FA|nr:hypothetical protein [Rossellomorea marisflavi]
MTKELPVLNVEQDKAMRGIARMIDGCTSAHSVWASKGSVIRFRMEGNYFANGRKAANTIPEEDFIKALYLGYTVEEAPEERLLERYRYFRTVSDGIDYADGVADGIKMAAQILGHKVKGVNAQ